MNVLITILKIIFVIVISTLVNSILYAVCSFLSFLAGHSSNTTIDFVVNIFFILSFFVLPFFLYRLFFRRK
jgi:hypothetical protein